MIQTTFNGGEITPLAQGRPDLAIYATACSRMRNCRALIHGGFTRDPGLEHLGLPLSNNRARLVPFEFSADVRYILEFTNLKLRVWSTGDTPAVVGSTLDTPFATADLRALHFSQLNDLVFITHPDHPPQLLSRTGATTFTLDDFAFRYDPLLNQNADDTHELTFTAGTPNTLVSSADLFDADHIGAVFEVAHQRTVDQARIYEDIIDATPIGAQPNKTTGTLTVDGEFTIQTYGTWTARLTVEQSEDGGGSWDEILFYESANNANFSESHTTPRRVLLRVVMTLRDKTGSANNPRVVVTASDPYVRGTVRITDVSDAQNAEVDIIDEPLDTATSLWSEAAFSDFRGWPAAVVLHRQRLIFAGTAYEPQKLYASRIDNYDDFRRPTGTDEAADADSAFALNIVSTQQNRISYLSSQKELVAGTSAGEYAIAGDQQNGTFAEGSLQVIPISHFGSAALQPIDSEVGLIFLQRGCRTVRHIGALVDIIYSPPELDDLSLFGEHLTRQCVLEHAYQRSPEPIYWAITEDGKLAGYTHKPSQKVLAWHSHDFGTTVAVESIAVTRSDGEEDQLWLCLAHTKPDDSIVRTLERFALGMREAQDAGDWPGFRFLHHWRTYTAVADTPLTITDFGHLEDRTLTVILEGQPLTTVVASSSFDVTPPISGTLVVGIAYEAAVTTLPPIIQTRSGPAGFLTVSQIGRMQALPYKTGELTASVAGGQGSKVFPSRPFGADLEAMPALLDEPLELAGLSGHSNRPSVTLSTSSPWPLTVLALNYDLIVNQE